MPVEAAAPAGTAASTSISASSPPTGIVAPSGAMILTSVPATGDGISALTLSVTISTSDSSRSTLSPSALSQREITPSVTDSPSCGIVIGVAMTNYPHHLDRCGHTATHTPVYGLS